MEVVRFRISHNKDVNLFLRIILTRYLVCEYFGITPEAFFHDRTTSPIIVQRIMDELPGLSEDDLLILPAEATKDWLNTRYAPEDVLKAAWLDVTFEPEQEQQISLL